MKKSSKKQTAKRAKEIRIENNAPPVVNWPDSDARRKKIFGNRVLNTVEDFLKSRHRDGNPPATYGRSLAYAPSPACTWLRSGTQG
jgi:hypothetical protein